MSIRLESPLLANAGFRHGFSTRELDLSFSAERYDASLQRFADACGFDARGVVQAEQVHGADVALAEEVARGATRPKADALVSAASGPAVGVRVADCVPILVGDRQSGRVAAIHAGWKGFVAGVIGAALAKLEAAPDSCVAAIGPCIRPCCFEVGRDVAARIAAAATPAVIAREAGDKAFVDLRTGVRTALVRAGLRDAAIDEIAGCTRCDAARFFSFRRGGESGRMLGAIMPLVFP